MYDASGLVRQFHDEHVRLTRAQKSDMQRRRDVNVERLKAGLRELGRPGIVDTINQGGYAMNTMTQPPEADEESRYDIDLGVVFEAADTKMPLTTKTWVGDAIAKKASRLMKHLPDVKKKCVRVIYANGYQCDFPVFRRRPKGSAYEYEIAIGDEWVASNPAAINRWFEDEVRERSPNGDDGYQLRRVVRLLKYFAKTHACRTGRKFPAGLVATALAVECYRRVEGRDDQAFYRTLEALSVRSEFDSVWANGTIVSDLKDFDRIRRLRDAASEAVAVLRILEAEKEVPEADARKAWKKVFRHSFFNEPEAARAIAGFEQKSVFPVRPTVVAAPAFMGLGDTERYRRADAAARDLEDHGRPLRPWAR